MKLLKRRVGIFCLVFLFLLLSTKQSYAWKFAVVGDTRPGTSYDHSQNIYGITFKIPNNEIVTVVNSGDLTSDGTASQWVSFKNIVSPLGITDWTINNPPKYIAAVGNHDNHDSNWLANWENNLPAQKGLSAYASIPADPSGRFGSVKYDNTIFVWADSISMPSGQETFLQNTLVQAKNDPQVVWKFVVFHKPPVSCGGSHSDWSGGKTWHDKYFYPNGVDMIFLGDNHYYERTCPFKSGLASSGSNEQNVCDTNNRGNIITNADGVIHVITGGGGAELYSVSSCPWLDSALSIHQFMEFEILGNFLHVKVWDTDTGIGSVNPLPANTNFNLIDDFIIQKGAASITPVPSTTPTITPTRTPTPTPSRTPTPTPTVPAQSSLPAFPGAEGFGAKAWQNCNRSQTKVLEVTSLDAGSGAGTLRAAINASGPRVVVFKVGGAIDSTINGYTPQEISIANPCIIIAGQTAPGDGILLKGITLRVRTNDVIIRGLRIRVGDTPGGLSESSRDGIKLESSSSEIYNVIVDHNSISWGVDENVSTWSCYTGCPYDMVRDITFSWNIISEALNYTSHSKGLLVGDHSKNITIHHNLFTHNNDRNSENKGDTIVEFINNMVYNWGQRSNWSTTLIGDWEGSGPNFINVIGNFYKKGPSSDTSHGIEFTSRISNWPNSRVYVHDNLDPYRISNSQDDWVAVHQASTYSWLRSNTPVVASSGVVLDTADTIEAKILPSVGAILPKRDAVDNRVILSVQNGTGNVINSQNDVGGWPVINGGTAPADTDHDGMPDAWEQSYGLNPNVNDSAQDRNSDGYINIEEYINGLFGSTPNPTPIPTPLPGDVNGDGSVNISDLGLLLSNFGRTGAGITGDINGDNRVNISDLGILLSNFGRRI